MTGLLGDRSSFSDRYFFYRLSEYMWQRSSSWPLLSATTFMNIYSSTPTSISLIHRSISESRQRSERPMRIGLGNSPLCKAWWIQFLSRPRSFASWAESISWRSSSFCVTTSYSPWNLRLHVDVEPGVKQKPTFSARLKRTLMYLIDWQVEIFF